MDALRGSMWRQGTLPSPSMFPNSRNPRWCLESTILYCSKLQRLYYLMDQYRQSWTVYIYSLNFFFWLTIHKTNCQINKKRKDKIIQMTSPFFLFTALVYWFSKEDTNRWPTILYLSSLEKKKIIQMTSSFFLLTAQILASLVYLFSKEDTNRTTNNTFSVFSSTNIFFD